MTDGLDASGLAPMAADTACYAGLVLARILPIVAFTPLFGGEAASRRLRMTLALLIAVPMSLHADSSPLREMDRFLYALLVLKEVLVGGSMAILVTVAFESLGAAGALMDLARGQSMASVLDPQSHQSVSPLSTFMRQAALTLFLSCGGYGVVCAAIEHSLRVLPPTRLPSGESLLATVLEVGLGAIPSLFLIAVRLALPTFVASLAVDAVMGLIGRAAPGIQTYFLAMPLRAIACFVVVLLSVEAAFMLFGRELTSLLDVVSDGLGIRG